MTPDILNTKFIFTDTDMASVDALGCGVEVNFEIKKNS